MQRAYILNLPVADVHFTEVMVNGPAIVWVDGPGGDS